METAMHDAYESKNDRIHEFIPKADFWTGKMMCVGCKTISTTNGKSILTSPSMWVRILSLKEIELKEGAKLIKGKT